MSYRIINRPHFVPESSYRKAINNMTDRLKTFTEIESIYQIGGISAPGISDIDMVVVFKDNTTFTINLLDQLSPEERYLFVHYLYGASKSDFVSVCPYIFFHNFSLLHGQDQRPVGSLPEAELGLLKIQIALEFIVKMKINLYLQQLTKVLRLRDLLLHVKALQYDFEFLGISSGRLPDKVNQVIEWRAHWFSSTPGDREIIDWWNEFNEEFELFLDSVFTKFSFFLPENTGVNPNGKIKLVPEVSAKLFISRTGILLPPFLSFIGKRYFSLQNRLNDFIVHIPVSPGEMPGVLGRKFITEKKHIENNRQNLPRFFAMASSLPVF